MPTIRVLSFLMIFFFLMGPLDQNPWKVSLASAAMDGDAQKSPGLMDLFMQFFAGPDKAYQAFAEHLFKGRFDEAKKLAGSDKARQQVSQKNKVYGPCRARYGDRYSHSKFKTHSKTKQGDKKTVVQLSQVVTGDPPGVQSAFGSAQVQFDHTATMIKTPEGWRVDSFEFKSRPNKDYQVFKWACYE